MSVVVDASIVVAALTETDHRGIWAGAVMSGEELLAPDLMPYEVAQVLRRLERSGAIRSEQAYESFLVLGALDIQLYPFDDLNDRIWSLRHNFSSYDAAYVATAEIAGAPLATLDLKMASQPADCDFLTPP
ncbi:MAG: type II toxin-antitoxin system VapC family toxin [Pseudomonadales bacterium]|nr:type II toxin-antitoxin system VapC family toxin [Pseudomonadales bacterium]MBO6564663.1 type II toxin-antitoxin system VapC family toxin [Pseudomonadales bacterium]MBO6595956.1 type II toxin-antitoxin system VapC family toxin [Pseudomonadales bacterium]MBO6656822.1 type II toxin-antitoxin system VapC family toxin [Pseudomonadales bacterium]MBO6702561.1 type II toxin-antitoxin system VapC family toxin [Pseudomonadales bacterium]